MQELITHFRENKIALDTINDFTDVEQLHRFVSSATSVYNVHNISMYGLFYIQEYAHYYDKNIDLIKNICEKYNYEDKRKNDIMKQRKVQFAVYHTYLEILEEIEKCNA